MGGDFGGVDGGAAAAVAELVACVAVGLEEGGVGV